MFRVNVSAKDTALLRTWSASSTTLRRPLTWITKLACLWCRAELRDHGREEMKVPRNADYRT